MSEKEKLTFSYYGNSDIGLIRIENQDSFGKFPPDDSNLYSNKGQLFIVADGMGGHVGGKEASSIAVDTIHDVYFSCSSELLSSLKEAIEKANSNIYRKSENSDKLRGMGTTCTVLVIKEDKGLIAHVGDSRIYMIENNSAGKIEQLTEDHTKVHEMVKEGILTEKEAEVYPSKSVLMRALGVEKKVNVDFKHISIKKGQSFILCSDGLAGVAKDEILQIVAGNSPEESCNTLIKMANERGGKDNVTVLVIKIGSNNSPSFNDTTLISRKRKNYILPVLAVLFFLIIIAIGIQYRNYITRLFQKTDSGEIVKDKPVVQPDDKRINEKKTDSFNELQSQADKLYEDGKMEDALVIYNKILDSEPMHLGALQGINNIASDFISKGEKSRNESRFDEAVKFYKKALYIQPSNDKLKKLILECEEKIHK